jgi:hypothetical protein
MSMNEFRRLAARIDQHMQQLAAEGVSEAHAIINRMMGYVPDLHRIWVGTSDQQLMTATRHFVQAATSKSSSPSSMSWGGCIGNGCPIWTASKTPYVRKAQNPRYWNT